MSLLSLSLDFLSNDAIGIIGCGHLGRTLAAEFVARGIQIDNLKVSCGRSVSSLQGIKNSGLQECLAENEEICRDCSIIFITVRPQSLPKLKGLHIADDALVISCMAGVSLQTIKKHLGADALRMMPSGPSTIKERKGIAAIYPHNDYLYKILSGLQMQIFNLKDEDLMHIFTAGVCLPAALLAAGDDKIGQLKASEILAAEYADFPKICAWAEQVLPEFERDEDKENYIRSMATKGGITEAIVEGINAGDSLYVALNRGIKRSREISYRFEADMLEKI
jgi:pyrroline-5-carboxylate reductase